jgi:membrane associated rhomboid family serine protease
MFRFTPVVKNLLIINVLVYIGQQIIPVLTEYIALWGTSTPYFSPYQLFTYMFAHDPESFWHLAGNMLFLVFTGPILEEYWGQKKFLFFYMAAGIGAAIFYVVMGLFSSGGSNSVMYGASGAVYGVMTAFGIIFSEMEIRIFFFIPIKAKYLILILGSLAIINSIGPMSGSGDGIAHLAHLGGIVVAIILLLYWRSKGRY